MVVQAMLEYLRDKFDSFQNGVLRGTSSVVAGTTTLVVTHSLGSSTYSVAASPLVNPGGAWWLSNKTGSQFQINLAVAAPVGGVAFDWVVKGG
jgi:hypothetical protein